VEGDPGTTKWVLIVNADRKRGEGGSFGVYFLGDFDGRRVLISWMNNWDYARVLPTSP
jgi:sucrose-6-phosphate hydrolase SacC (GH32 family)